MGISIFKRAAVRLGMLLCLIISLGSITSSEGTSSERWPDGNKIIAVIPADFPPTYFRDDKTGQASGFAVDIFNVIARKAGLDVDYIYAKSWEEIENKVISGEADVIPNLGVSERRRMNFAFTENTETFTINIFTRAQDKKIKELEKGLHVGVIKGSIAYDLVTKVEGVNIELFDNFQTLLFDLISGQIDALVGPTPNILKLALDVDVEDKIKSVGNPLLEVKRAIGIKKDNTLLLERLNKEVIDLTGSPEYRDLYLKWFGKPKPYWTNQKFLFAIFLVILLTVMIMAFWRYFSIFKLNRLLKNNIEELMRAEEKLGFFVTILKTIPDGVCSIDLSGNITSWNDGAEKMLGYKSSEIIDMPVTITLPEEIRESELKHILNVLNTEGYFIGYESSRLTKDGRLIPVDISGITLKNKEGSIVGYASIIRDITERKLKEKAIINANEEWKRTFDSVSDLIAILDKQHRIQRVNKAMADRLGATPQQLVGRHCYEVVHGKSEPPYYCPHARLLISGKEERSEFTDDYLSGFFEVRTSPIRDETEQVIGSVHIVRDITEHRKLEDQLRQAQKMEGIGQLAGGIAHDFNNILSVIVGYGKLSIMDMKDDDPNRLNIEQILYASDRAIHLTKDLLLFSRKQSIEKKPIEINGIINKVEKFLTRVIGEDIVFNTNLCEKELIILGDSHQLEQVFMNLATNARDAMPKGGIFSITTEEINLDKDLASLRGLERSGRYALISISDTGHGMDKGTRQRIFEPFFTTKEVGKGTGLGLAVVYGIVHQHEGNIDVYSEKDMGSTFRIYLPITETAESDDKTAISDKETARGTETILLAEDNEFVRILTSSVLKRYGYTVIEAVDGEDAVTKYKENKNRIRLLLFDIVMPNMNGKEAYDEIKKITPDIKIIFASGYSPDIVSQKLSTDKNIPLIYKPVSPVNLSRIVREVLDK